MLLWCHKNVFPPPQPQALAQSALGVSGLGCESGGSAGKTLTRFVYRELRELLVASRSKSKLRDWNIGVGIFIGACRLKRAFSAGRELGAELQIPSTRIYTHTSKKLGGKNSDKMNIQWHSCCCCCCGNQAWQCVRQVNFRESKLFFKTVGETDGFCLKMDCEMFALWKYLEADQINTHSHPNSLLKWKGFPDVLGPSLLNMSHLLKYFPAPPWSDAWASWEEDLIDFCCICAGLLGLHSVCESFKTPHFSPFLFHSVKCWSKHIVSFLLGVCTSAGNLISPSLLPPEYAEFPKKMCHTECKTTLLGIWVWWLKMN